MDNNCFLNLAVFRPADVGILPFVVFLFPSCHVRPFPHVMPDLIGHPVNNYAILPTGFSGKT